MVKWSVLDCDTTMNSVSTESGADRIMISGVKGGSPETDGVVSTEQGAAVGNVEMHEEVDDWEEAYE